MNDIIDPAEIKSITSNTPITITFNDGGTITAYNFHFKDSTRCTTVEDDGHTVNLEVIT